MTTYNFNNITTDTFNEQDRELFTELYNGTLIENKPFSVELENGKEVELHIYIEHTDMSEYEEDNDDHIITLGVVPSFKCLTKEEQEKILGQYDFESDREKLKEDIIWGVEEVINNGMSIPLHEVTVKASEVEHILNSAIAIKSAVSGLIGFELDKACNRVGTTGWDLLNDYCCGVDFIKATMDRNLAHTK